MSHWSGSLPCGLDWLSCLLTNSWRSLVSEATSPFISTISGSLATPFPAPGAATVFKPCCNVSLSPPSSSCPQHRCCCLSSSLSLRPTSIKACPTSNSCPCPTSGGICCWLGGARCCFQLIRVDVVVPSLQVLDPPLVRMLPDLLQVLGPLTNVCGTIGHWHGFHGVGQMLLSWFQVVN